MTNYPNDFDCDCRECRGPVREWLEGNPGPGLSIFTYSAWVALLITAYLWAW